MSYVSEEIDKFLKTGNLEFVCKYSESGQIFLPAALVKYLKLEAGKDSICFSVLRDGPNKGEIRFAAVHGVPRRKEEKD